MSDVDTIARLRDENRRLRERINHLESQRVHGLGEDATWTQQLLEGVPLGLVHVLLDGAVVFANTEAQRILGLTFDVLERKYVNDFQGKTYREDGSECPVIDYPVTQCLMTGEPQSPKMIGVQQRDSTVSWAVFTAIPTLGETLDTHTGALVTFVDVTEMQRSRIRKRELEHKLHQVQRLEALGKLAGGMAHDMNNILAVISGMAFYLSEEGTADEKALDAITRSAERGRELVGNLLRFARHTSSAQRQVQLNDLVTEVCSVLWRTLPDGVQLLKELTEPLPVIVGDPGQLSNALMNLCINAIDAMGGQGGGTITVRTTSEEDVVELEVSDDGCGIEEEHLEKVVEPFFSTKEQGTGLGLSMVYGSVTHAGGELLIDSESGVGTAVRMRFSAHNVSES